MKAHKHFGCVLFADRRVRNLTFKRMQNLRGVGKNDGPILSRLWTKVHEISGRHSRPLVLSNTLARLSISVSYTHLTLPTILRV